MTEPEPAEGQRVFGLALPELLAFALYCSIQVWMCLVHEAWGDEAQAWLLARDSSLIDLFYQRLHYEGTPGLWHLLLWIETRLGVSYLGMHFITSALAAVGVYLFLRFAPLPTWLKLLFPFIFAILYQGPIVARSYLLTLPLIAALSVVRRQPHQRPVAYAVLLGLLVNTSALGALLAIGLLIEWLFSALQGRWRFTRSAVIRSASVTVLFWAAALYCILPAPDAHFGFLGGLTSKPAAARVLAKLTGTPPPAATSNATAKPAAASPVDTPPSQQVSRNRLQQKLYDLEFPRGKVTLATHLLRQALLISSFALFVISPSNLLAIAFYVALLLWLVKHRALHFALPFVLLAIIGPKLYISPHHAMMWWFALLGLIWTAWPSLKEASHGRRIDIAFQLFLGVVLVQQVVFAAHALYFDNRYAFDGGEAAERFLTESAPKGAVAGYTFFPVSMQPYSRTNLFVNRPTTYERWRKQDNVDLAIETVGRYHPRMVVISETYSGTRDAYSQLIPFNVPGTLLIPPDERRYLTANSYVETHRFCGEQPIDFGTYEKVCEIIFEPRADQPK
jgi:hypothetical protein